MKRHLFLSLTILYTERRTHPQSPVPLPMERDTVYPLSRSPTRFHSNSSPIKTNNCRIIYLFIYGLFKDASKTQIMCCRLVG
jgi:hypothetical protein